MKRLRIDSHQHLSRLRAIGLLACVGMVACVASSSDPPASNGAPPEVTTLPETASASLPRADAPSAGPTQDGRVALAEIVAVLQRDNLLVSDVLTAKGLADLEKDVTAGLASVRERRARLDPKSPNHRKASAMLNAMEAQYHAQLADLRDGLYLTVDERFAGRQSGLQVQNPSWLFVLMSPKESRTGRAIVIFCLDLERHVALQEARRQRSLAWRVDPPSESPQDRC